MNLLNLFSDEMAHIAENTRQSLVQITDGRGSIGSGTIWHPDGLIVTNAHVIVEHRPVMRGRGRFGRMPVRRMRDVRAILPDGRELPLQTLAIDESNDLAALCVEANGLPTIAPGDSTRMRPGQWVMAMGHPWGVSNSLTAGIVIGSGANLPEIPPGREWIALDLKLRPGHSGGPLVDTNGKLIGVNTMITGPAVGFAIPSHVVKRFLKDALGETASSGVVV